MDKPDVVLMNPELIMQAANSQNNMKLVKVVGIYDIFYSWLKKGIVCMQKEEWKHRKKTLSQVFNYDFITSQIPLMINVANNVFDKFEEKQKQSQNKIKSINLT